MQKMGKNGDVSRAVNPLVNEDRPDLLVSVKVVVSTVL